MPRLGGWEDPPHCREFLYRMAVDASEVDQRSIEAGRRSAPLRTARAALAAMASKTGRTSVCDLPMTRRISPVAVCCSSASVSDRRRLRPRSSDPRTASREAGPGEGRAALSAELRPLAILMLAAGTGHTERLPSPDRERPARHSVTAPGPPPEPGVPAVPCGTGAPTLPRADLGRQPPATAPGRLAAGPGCLPTRWRSGGDPPAGRRARTPSRSTQAAPLPASSRTSI